MMIKTKNPTLNKILIKTRRQVFSEISGNNTSLLKGEGYDFCELKEYEYGEDVKNIDWVISAKLHTPYVKVFHTQKELNIALIPILTGSVFFGSKKLKQEVITEIVSLLGYSCVKQSDPFTSYIANETLSLNTKKTKRLLGVNLMSETIFNYPTLGKDVNYRKMCTEIYSTIKKRSIIFLIGDFIDIAQLDLTLLSKKHEILLIIVRDKFEEEPLELGNIHFIDSNTSKSFEGNMNPSLINAYKTKIKENDHTLFLHLQKCGIKFTKIYTHEEPFGKLIGLMQQ